MPHKASLARLTTKINECILELSVMQGRVIANVF